MGFFDTFKRLVSGQTPFEVPPPDGSETKQEMAARQQAPAGQEPGAKPTGPKVIPQIDIERTTWRDNGPNMQVTCVIQNNSQGTIELDKIIMLGRSLELDNFLRPGEERQYNVYNGPRPQNMNYRTAEVYFRDESGDYFCADHNIEYEREADNTYRIVEMRRLRIRDV